MYEKELIFATDLAKKAGEIIKANFRPNGALDAEWKEDDSPLTKTDTVVNEMVVVAVKNAYPDHAVLGEECSSDNLGKTAYVWVCDPIDGTIPFSLGWPCSVFMLALCKDGQPVVAVIYEPYFDRLYTATLGSGCFLNGIKVRVNNITDFSRTYIGFGFAPWYDKEVQMRWVRNMMDKNVRTMLLHSCGYNGMLITSGQLSGLIFQGSSAWDAAPLGLLIEEAGGKFTDLQGNDQRYDTKINGFIASNGVMHEQILSLLR